MVLKLEYRYPGEPTVYQDGLARMVFAFKDDDHLIRVFDTALSTSDDQSAATLALTAVGDIVLGQPGAKQKRVFRWNPQTLGYAEAR